MTWERLGGAGSATGEKRVSSHTAAGGPDPTAARRSAGRSGNAKAVCAGGKAPESGCDIDPDRFGQNS